ncbi:MAG: aminoacetone oxidase family FAD-binding enzyme [Bacteroidales bacterium]|nr:aminoacetone oxidase family FAD-binding enzyme [Bacteroidales bacterium]
MNVAIVGGGASGVFCAIELKRRLPSAQITIYESNSKILAKLEITGGGRCNLTNISLSELGDIERISPKELEKFYPRGASLMKRALATLSQRQTMQWFENEGVKLTIQEDGCVFPASQNAMEIVSMFKRRLKELDIKVVCNKKIENIEALQEDIIVITAGGQPSPSGFAMLQTTKYKDIEIVPPCPSLFTFNIDCAPLKRLAGCVVEAAEVSLASTRFTSNGALLITDWGVSGPAILKLSSYAARYLKEKSYQAELIINWLGEDYSSASKILKGHIESAAAKKLLNIPLRGLTGRLWELIVSRSGIREDITAAEIGTKGFNRLVNTLINDTYPITGKGRFKDEFVTCGGVAIKEIALATMQCKRYPNLYFAGEIIDIDAITGGYNLQAAWSTGYTAARSIALNNTPTQQA